jgi:malto-oligosyltrehalose trehalohydrolase
MAGFVRSRDAVRVQAMPYGTQILPGDEGTLFRLWAPTARTVELMIENQPIPMQRTGSGWVAAITQEAGHGTLYRFRIDGDLQVPDPASRFQPQDVHGPSQVVDPDRFEWRDTDWCGRPWREAVIYELHVGAFSPEGTFQGVQNKLDYLVDLGVTAIELMPVAEFPGRYNWGYDGVMLFAPDSRYGTPDELKSLVQAAHQKGLMILLDVVYNHFGPEGNYLHAYAESFFTRHHHTPWGAAINFEGAGEQAEGGRAVRDFFIQNALYWLNEYHFDGLRFDAVHAIRDESEKHFLEELAETIRLNVDPERHIHLVLENDDNTARFLAGDPERVFTAQWNDDFHHAIHVLIAGDTDGYYTDYAWKTSGKSPVEHLARALAEGFAYQGEASPYRQGRHRGEPSTQLHPIRFVNFLQNHDQVGNRAFGERLNTLARNTTGGPEALRAVLALSMLGPSIPLLFMGEEWGTETPFLFFCDFNKELAPQVAEGRRREFAKFPAFSDPATHERIPDPSLFKTFTDSCLDWDELEEPQYAVWLRFYKNLLAIRAQDIIPLLPLIPASAEGSRRYEILGPNALAAQWKLSDGRTLILAANLGAEPLTFHLADHHNLKLIQLELIYQSEDQVLEQLQSGGMPAWSVVWCLKQ